MLYLRIQITRRDGGRILLSPDVQDLLLTMTGQGKPVPNASLVAAIGHAFALHAEQLRTGGSIERVAKRFGHTDVWARVLLDLTKLGPAV